MKISRAWLQTFFAEPLPEVEALSDAFTFHAFEIDGVEKVGEDDVLDVKVTADRGHDCLSYRGIALELSAILKLPLKEDPLAGSVDLSKKTEAVTVSVEDAVLCPRYVSAFIRRVKVGPSPVWLVERLAAMGQRSVNNVVDATNFVMFHTGQPLHAFDAAKLQKNATGGYAIAVRHARVGEELLALDDKVYTLAPEQLVIADAVANVAVGVAGVKGGKPAGITEVTTDIIIESANFNGVSVRKTAQALKLRTDASARFEQVLAPELAAYGMRAVVALITELAGGEVDGYVDECAPLSTPVTISVTVPFISGVLGAPVTALEVGGVLSALKFGYREESGAFLVVAPWWRLDISCAEDIVEEVGRILGYDRVLPASLPLEHATPELNADIYVLDLLTNELALLGATEVYTTVFAETSERHVLNKIDGTRPYLRTTLAPELSVALTRNIHVKESVACSRVVLFEIGFCWSGGVEERHLAIAAEPQKKQPTAKALLESLCAKLGVAVPSVLTETPELVEVRFADFVQSLPIPAAYPEYPAVGEVHYRPYSRFPYMVRDVAFFVPASVEEESLHTLIVEAAGPLLLRTDRFDRFEKEGRVSYAFRLVFQSMERTLEEHEAAEAMVRVYAALSSKGYEVR